MRRGKCKSIEITCANPLCAKTFTFKEGPSHLTRRERHCCSRACQNTTHGFNGTHRHRIWQRARRRAQECGIPFSLTLHDIPEIPVVCPVLGIALRRGIGRGPRDFSPSLDRLRPTLGYVPGNVRIISNRANRIRSDATAVELMIIAEDAAAVEAA